MTPFTAITFFTVWDPCRVRVLSFADRQVSQHLNT